MGFSLNSVTISGNLTRDPELRTLRSGTAVCNIRIAYNERYKDGVTGEWSDRANYFDIDIWRGIGEWVARNLSKGDQIAVVGRLRWREWETEDGKKGQAVSITADGILPTSGRDGGGNGRQAQRSEEAQYDGGFTPRSDIPSDPEPEAEAVPAGGGSADDDDIPF